MSRRRRRIHTHTHILEKREKQRRKRKRKRVRNIKERYKKRRKKEEATTTTTTVTAVAVEGKEEEGRGEQQRTIVILRNANFCAALGQWYRRGRGQNFSRVLHRDRSRPPPPHLAPPTFTWPCTGKAQPASENASTSRETGRIFILVDGAGLKTGEKKKGREEGRKEKRQGEKKRPIFPANYGDDRRGGAVEGVESSRVESPVNREFLFEFITSCRLFQFFLVFFVLRTCNILSRSVFEFGIRSRASIRKLFVRRKREKGGET